jgi:hypothetical protein
MLLKDMGLSYCVRHNLSPYACYCNVLKASAFLTQSLTVTTSASSFPRIFESPSAHAPRTYPPVAYFMKATLCLAKSLTY